MGRVCKWVGHQTCALCDAVIDWHITTEGRRHQAEKEGKRVVYRSALRSATMPDEEYHLYILEMMAHRLNYLALRKIKGKPIHKGPFA